MTSFHRKNIIFEYLMFEFFFGVMETLFVHMVVMKEYHFFTFLSLEIFLDTNDFISSQEYHF
jgi:hypothetical protein